MSFAAAKQGIIEDYRLERGEKFVELAKVSHKKYKGPTLKEGNFRSEEVCPILEHWRSTSDFEHHRLRAMPSSTSHFLSRIATRSSRHPSGAVSSIFQRSRTREKYKKSTKGAQLSVIASGFTHMMIRYPISLAGKTL